MSSMIGACHAWGGGGITLSSSLEVTCICKQYPVSGQSGVGFLAGHQDGECDGALSNASGFSWRFQPFVSVRVWPPIWILISGFKLSKLLNLVAIDTKTVVMNWNSGYVHAVWAQRPMQENKDTNGLAVTMSYPQWVRDLFICHQQIPMQTWEHFLPGKSYSTAFSNHRSGNLRDGHKPSELHTAKPDLWDPATSSWAHPGMPDNVTHHGDAGWIGGLTKVMIYPAYTNLHQRIAVLAAPIQGSSGSRGQATWLTCKQLKQTNSGCPR